MSITLSIEGMSCQHCVANVKQSLEAVPGVTAAVVDLEAGSAQVEGQDLSQEQLEQAVIDAGYGIGQGRHPR